MTLEDLFEELAVNVWLLTMFFLLAAQVVQCWNVFLRPGKLDFEEYTKRYLSKAIVVGLITFIFILGCFIIDFTGGKL